MRKSDELPVLDYEATDYDGLCLEISDVFMGETGDLVREHAKAVLALRRDWRTYQTLCLACMLRLMDEIEKLLADAEEFAADRSNARYDLECLRAWKRLALCGHMVGEGDRVALRQGFVISGNRTMAGFAEWMRPGQPGVVRKIGIRPSDLLVYADVVFESEWSAHKQADGRMRRYRRDPHIFMVPLDDLRPALDTDVAYVMPTEGDA